MRKTVLGLCTLACLSFDPQAQASVLYSFHDESGLFFHFETSELVTTGIAAPIASRDDCGGSFGATCYAVLFLPHVPPNPMQGLPEADLITFSYHQLLYDFVQDFSFELDTFSTIGHHDALNAAATLDISYVPSAVPLPSAAPLFGAALLALGLAGYGMRRKKPSLTS